MIWLVNRLVGRPIRQGGPWHEDSRIESLRDFGSRFGVSRLNDFTILTEFYYNFILRYIYMFGPGFLDKEAIFVSITINLLITDC